MASELPPAARRLLAPLCFIAAIPPVVTQALHVKNTCADWLMRWGQLAETPNWVRIHEVAMMGFALAAAIGIFYPLLVHRSGLSVVGGAALSGGAAISAITVLIHATATSSLGRAYNAATSDPARQLIKTAAEAAVSYDIAATSAASILVSAGGCLLAWSLYREGGASLIPTLLLIGLAAAWALQYHNLFRFVHVTLPPMVHWATLSAYFAGLGALLLAGGRRSAAP
jgi:hypothetical protein